jgi:hypothetical protein
MTVTSIDLIAFGALIAWSLWWILAPSSAIQFYFRFHRGKLRSMQPKGVRVVGAFMFLLVVAVFWRVFGWPSKWS